MLDEPIYEALVNGLELTAFRDKNLAFEVQKARLIFEEPKLADIIFKIEDDTHFRGSIHSILHGANQKHLVKLYATFQSVWSIND